MKGKEILRRNGIKRNGLALLFVWSESSSHHNLYAACVVSLTFTRQRSGLLTTTTTIYTFCLCRAFCALCLLCRFCVGLCGYVLFARLSGGGLEGGEGSEPNILVARRENTTWVLSWDLFVR